MRTIARVVFPEAAKRRLRPIYADMVRAYRRRMPRRVMMPGFLIIGVQKGGSSALFYYLGQHPQVKLALSKEPHYFDMHYDYGLEWYKSEFPAQQRGIITGEASPYYVFHPLARQRICETLPEAKLILLLRDPVSRAYSHYQHMVRRGAEPLPFEEAIEAEPERLKGEVEKMIAQPTYFSFSHIYHSYLSRGMYADQIEAWWELFPREQMLILSSEEFFAKPDAVFGRVLEFLGLPQRSLTRSPQMNKGDYAPINPETRKRLQAHFKPHSERLYRLVGQDFGWGR